VAVGEARAQFDAEAEAGAEVDGEVGGAAVAERGLHRAAQTDFEAGAGIGVNQGRGEQASAQNERESHGL
jgi:hypothetical protein